MSEKLKPCPFCGGEAHANRHPTRPNELLDTITCTECDIELWPGEEDANVVEAWNRRASERRGYIVVQTFGGVTKVAGEDGGDIWETREDAEHEAEQYRRTGSECSVHPIGAGSEERRKGEQRKPDGRDDLLRARLASPNMTISAIRARSGTDRRHPDSEPADEARALREALEEIEALGGEYPPDGSDVPRGWSGDRHADCVRIARRALREAGGEHG